MKKHLLVLFLFIFLSCQKEELPFQSRTITEMTANMEGDIKELSQLRLSFGKAVANALEDVEFREYINTISRKNTQSYFNEIVFALHKDDIAVGNKTLETVIKEAVCKETKELY